MSQLASFPLPLQVVNVVNILPQSATRRDENTTDGALKFEDGETTRQNLRLLYDFFGFFQWIFVSDIYYLAMVWQRGLGRPPETYHPIQVRLFRAASPYKTLV